MSACALRAHAIAICRCAADRWSRESRANALPCSLRAGPSARRAWRTANSDRPDRRAARVKCKANGPSAVRRVTGRRNRLSRPRACRLRLLRAKPQRLLQPKARTPSPSGATIARVTGAAIEARATSPNSAPAVRRRVSAVAATVRTVTGRIAVHAAKADAAISRTAETSRASGSIRKNVVADRPIRIRRSPSSLR